MVLDPHVHLVVEPLAAAEMDDLHAGHGLKVLHGAVGRAVVQDEHLVGDGLPVIYGERNQRHLIVAQGVEMHFERLPVPGLVFQFLVF